MSSSKANHRVKQQESIRHEARRAHYCSLSGLRRTSLLFPQSVPVLTLYADLFLFAQLWSINICRILLVRVRVIYELCTRPTFLKIYSEKMPPTLNATEMQMRLKSSLAQSGVLGSLKVWRRSTFACSDVLYIHCIYFLSNKQSCNR